MHNCVYSSVAFETQLQIAVLSGIKAVVGKMSTTYQRAVDGFVSDRLAYLESRLSTAFEYRALPSGPGDGSARKRRKTLNSIRSSWSTLQESLVRCVASDVVRQTPALLLSLSFPLETSICVRTKLTYMS
jgi:hypothetical protein